MQPQITPQSNPQVKSTNGSLSFSQILPICSLVIAIISLIVSIFSIIISNTNQTSSTEIDDESGGTFQSAATKVSCNLPTKAEDVVFLYLGYNQGKSGLFVSPDGSIEYFNNGTNTVGDDLSTTKRIKTDAEDIFKELLNNGVNEFSDYEENESEEVDWNWLAQIDNTDSSSCEVKGNDAPPTWFTNLVNLVESKIDQ